MTITTPQNAYLVAAGTGTLYPTVILSRDPTMNDLSGPNGQKFQVTQRWVNSVTDVEWFLLNFTTTKGYYQATWVQIAGGSLMAETLTGNTGGAVGPTANNINVVGDGTTISVAGNPGTSTLTISAIGSGILESLTGDTGTATPSGGTINVFGNTAPAASGLTFTGSGHTLSLGGTLTVPHGGTGDTSFTAYSVITGGTTSTGPLQNVVGVGTAGQILVSNGAGALPSWQNSGSKTFSSIAVQVITTTGSPQTYTPTAGMLYCTVELIGGGGGGGGAATSGAGAGAAGGGGGAGGYSRKTFSAATIGVSQSVTIGVGGAAGAAGNNAGGNGGTTSFGALFSAGPGLGGQGSSASNNIGIPGGAGGAGASGDVNLTGGGGGAGCVTGSGGVALTGTGASIFGGSPVAEIAFSGSTAVTGTAASSYGAGGNGGGTTNASATAGGAGFQGICIITEFI